MRTHLYFVLATIFVILISFQYNTRTESKFVYETTKLRTESNQQVRTTNYKNHILLHTNDISQANTHHAELDSTIPSSQKPFVSSTFGIGASNKIDNVDHDAQLTPVILLPGDGGSRLQAKLNRTSVNHHYCERRSTDWFDLWVNLSLLVPFALDCWVDK